MAKKQTSNVTIDDSPAQPKPISAGDINRLVLTKALEEAAGISKGECSDKKAKLPTGTYGFRVTATLQGTAVVASAAKVAPKPSVSHKTLLAAMLAGKGRAAVAKAVGAALKLVAESQDEDKPKKSASAKGLLEVSDEYVGEALEQQCLEMGLMTEAGTKAGATTVACKGTIKSNVGDQEVEVEIDEE